MGRRAPHAHDITDGRFPVRLTIVLASLEPRDAHNDRVRKWLQAHLGERGYDVVPGYGRATGERIVYLYLPDVYTAATLLLRHPYLRLAQDSG